MFAEDYPRFMEVSDLAPQPHRTNERYQAVFATNQDIFDGARVLDLASHDGRFSFAALKAGAAHVTGVEVRQSLIDQAEEVFSFYDQDPETYRFVCGDVFEVLARERFEVDVVLCLGYLYHTYRHTELMYRLHELAPKHLIVDTMVTPGTEEPTLRVIGEPNAQDIRSAAQDDYAVGRVLVLRPSVPAMKMLLHAYGFELESSYDWKGRLAGRPPEAGLKGYAAGERVTLRCRFDKAILAGPWDPGFPLPGAADPPPHPTRAKPKEADPAAVPPAAGWRGRVNSALVRTTGYELRRASTRR